MSSFPSKCRWLQWIHATWRRRYFAKPLYVALVSFFVIFQTVLTKYFGNSSINHHIFLLFGRTSRTLLTNAAIRLSRECFWDCFQELIMFLSMTNCIFAEQQRKCWQGSCSHKRSDSSQRTESLQVWAHSVASRGFIYQSLFYSLIVRSMQAQNCFCWKYKVWYWRQSTTPIPKETDPLSPKTKL